MLFWIIIIAAFIIDLIMAEEFKKVADEKGYTDNKYWWYTFLFGLYGMLLVIALPDKRGRNAVTEETKSADIKKAEDELPEL